MAYVFRIEKIQNKCFLYCYKWYVIVEAFSRVTTKLSWGCGVYRCYYFILSVESEGILVVIQNWI